LVPEAGRASRGTAATINIKKVVIKMMGLNNFRFDMSLSFAHAGEAA
jgi:hypothetical protein